MMFAALALLAGTGLLPELALAASSAPHVNGADFSIIWVVPFACMLLSIALGPLVVPHFWHHNYGKIAVMWATLFMVPFFMKFGAAIATYEFLHILLLDYVPFLVLLFSLFVVSGGVRLKGSLVGTPMVNAGILVIGSALASWMGTTGAAMLLIRPLLRANAHRKFQVHTVVFFIFCVANIGGSLTPLGDPPLFLGFLKGVSFFWTLEHLSVPMLFTLCLLIGFYIILDTVLYGKEGEPVPENAGSEKLGIEGGINFLFLAGIVAAVVMSGVWKPSWGLTIYHVTIGGGNLVRDLVLLSMAGLSWKFTDIKSRELNGFEWEPIAEVAKLFFGIFVSMIPALKILQAGSEGALASVISMVSTADGEPINLMYFWLTGLLSSFLDNAPTYLVFFNTAGGDAATLMGPMAKTLLAISCGAVFMGANTYIGNAPNFMVRSIAENQGVKMPSFFGYMAWSFGILVPVLVAVSLVFF